MRAVTWAFILVALFLSGCSHQRTSTYWDQYTPDKVDCPDRMQGFKVMKVCRQHGIYLICECAV